MKGIDQRKNGRLSVLTGNRLVSVDEVIASPCVSGLLQAIKTEESFEDDQYEYFISVF
jgi:hypothetical protein